ncbi:MAG: Asp-tRNA(Asn)/Glu-tRNA(Gln) amidotransferase subunit GatA [Spirochaetales bacterium]|nr:Asp-tRNA(Asn)/Glu-tRNA(Gln) amidotransferase subunit GatA [Spirochaetales bacterium]MCF7937844.1 Asp-tRNA(Asn)/Glu-tRNA(Gln) amidotransferase subunit GatA [Spirochaetales bacterium]
MSKEIQQGTEKQNAHVQELNTALGAFLQYNPELGKELSLSLNSNNSDNQPLSGMTFAVKDNIAVKGFRLTCGSKMLEKFISPYSATAVDRLVGAGATVVGKTNLDEFGMGSSTDNSALLRTNNPWNTDYVAGGSSGGSAAAVAAGLVPFALGTDTGGSVRQPAAFCGVYGLKPGYGSVSRYGLVAYASSLEGIGLLGLDIGLLKTSFETMAGLDAKDQTTTDMACFRKTSTNRKGRVALLGGLEGLSPEVEEEYRSVVSHLPEIGFTTEEVRLPFLDYVVPAYYTIAAAEASANLARYTGIRYGLSDSEAETPRELTELSRNAGFGPEVKLRILLGTFVLRSGFQDRYYLQAQKIRSALRKSMADLFQKYELILSPVFPVQAFPHDSDQLDPFQQKLADRFTATANLAGVPALSFPTGLRNGLPVGMQFIGPDGSEDLLFQAAASYRRIYEPEHPERFIGRSEREV